MWTAYTDGACAPSNPGPPAGAAVLIAPGGGGESDHFGFIGPGTNQIAELTAAIEGARPRARAALRVQLVSDSQYVLKGLTEWRAGWETQGLAQLEGRAGREPRTLEAARSRSPMRGASAVALGQGPQRRPLQREGRCARRTRRWRCARQRADARAAAQPAPLGQAALDLEQLEARQGQVGAVLLEQRRR